MYRKLYALFSPLAQGIVELRPKAYISIKALSSLGSNVWKPLLQIALLTILRIIIICLAKGVPLFLFSLSFCKVVT